MIVGNVNSFGEAIIGLGIRNARGVTQQIEAVIDTGFNGWLSLPPKLISTLDLPFRGRGRALLADGRDNIFDIYVATVIWDGKERRIQVDAAETDPLVGMKLLYGYELIIRVVDGGSVIIQELR